MGISGIKKDYYLISKTVGTRFSEYKGSVIRISETLPYSFDEIVIGNRNNPKEIRRITTFRDREGKAQEKVFDYWGRPIINKLFDYKSYIIGENEWIDKMSIKEFSLSRASAKLYKRLKDFLGNFFDPSEFWHKKQTRHNYVSSDISSPEEPKIISSIIINPKKRYETHDFIEYGSSGSFTPPKKLHLEIDRETHKVKTDKNADRSIIKDKFLGLRAYDVDDARIPMTEHFIRERKLEDTDLVINTNYIPQDIKEENSLVAFYTDSNGSINFNKFYHFYSKAKLAKVSSHETEHAWQWYLDARNTGGQTPYTQNIYKKFGALTTQSEREEAQRYTDSINTYISFKDDYQKYLNSYIEIMARKKGEVAELQYNLQGRAIRDKFPHIPPEVL